MHKSIVWATESVHIIEVFLFQSVLIEGLHCISGVIGGSL